MTHTIPPAVATALRGLYAAYQHDLSIVVAMLGIPDGATFNIDFDKGKIEIPDQPSQAIDAQEGVASS